jgi:alpha-D-xyloside xylohydrolase
MENVPSRKVYLPPGGWIDYQSGKAYEGAQWHHIPAGEVPIVMLVRNGAVIPHIGLAQSTTEMNWREIELIVFGIETPTAEGLFCLPEDDTLHNLRLELNQDGYELTDDPLPSRVEWEIRTFM